MFGIKCWVPHCNASNDLQPTCNFFPLPKDPKFKETWLALTGKKLVSEEQIYFCESHFRKSAFETVMGKVVGLTSRALPFYGMPQMICRTCMSTIPNTALFCVVSGTIPSPVPPELETDLVRSRPEPLYQILTFCVPSLNLEQNPPSLVCIKCYELIWQYFIFKLTCNSIENRIRGNLSLEDYGKIVLCRACLVVSGTRFFVLDESQPMGQVFKNVFLSTYPTHIVPLRLCLKCWNLLFKLTQFYQQCTSFDQVLQRCTEIRGQTYNKMSTLKANDTQPLQNPTEMSPSTSTCSNSSTTSNYHKLCGGVVEVKSVEMTDKKCIEKADLSVRGNEIDPEMPKLVSQIDLEDEPKPKTSNYAKKTLTLESKLFLASLMLKYSKLLKPNLDPIDRARADLEMWVSVMNEFHGAGYSNTLSSLQSLWSKMKSSARLAQKSMGPITYLDYFVNNCVTSASITSDSTDSSSAVGSEDLESWDDVANSNVNVILQRGIENRAPERNMPILTVQPSRNEAIVMKDDCDVICIDDEVEDAHCSSGVRKNSKNDSNKHRIRVSGTAIINLCDTDSKETNDIHTTKIKHALRKFRIEKGVKQPRHKSTGPSSQNDSDTKSHTKKRPCRDFWSVEQKLELVREMRKECIRLIETEELDSFKYTPWKNIVERLASRGFGGRDFPRLYSQWGKLKTSATIYEKNGQDIVDNEVWDLLQLHKDVQKNTLKKGAKRKNEENDEITVQRDGVCNKSKTPVPSKRPKLSNLDCKEGSSKTSAEAHQTSKTDAATSKRSHISLSEVETLEILSLMEREFNEMLTTRGVINETLTAILERINYKSYPMSVMMNHWQKATAAASASQANPTPVHQKVLELLKMYCQNKVSRIVNVFGERKDSEQEVEVQEITASSTEIGTKNGQLRNYEDRRNLSIIAVIKSFGNQVFKKTASRWRAKFWTQVSTKLHTMGYKMPRKDIMSLWGEMLSSAKLTWAQEDRESRVGDQEIIDFMTEVIQKKEKCEQGSQLDMSVQEDDANQEDPSDEEDPKNREEDLKNSEEDPKNSGEDPKNNEEDPKGSEEYPKKCEERLVKKEECLHKSDGKIVDDVEKSTEEDSESGNVIFENYDHVSLEDIQKRYGKDILENTKPFAVDEVIEILDSDGE